MCFGTGLCAHGSPRPRHFLPPFSPPTAHFLPPFRADNFSSQWRSDLYQRDERREWVVFPWFFRVEDGGPWESPGIVAHPGAYGRNGRRRRHPRSRQRSDAGRNVARTAVRNSRRRSEIGRRGSEISRSRRIALRVRSMGGWPYFVLSVN